jgi:hypothetical protein
MAEIYVGSHDRIAEDQIVRAGLLRRVRKKVLQDAGIPVASERSRQVSAGAESADYYPSGKRL